MASTIDPTDIRTNYPIAGQDNDSQGFRDNFASISNNFAAAKAEIEDLQNKVVLKSNLLGTTLNNDMAGAELKNAQLRAFTETPVDLSTKTGSVVLNYSSGNYQKFTTGDAVSLSFSGWPTNGQLGRMLVLIDVANVLHTVTLPTASYFGTGTLAGYQSSTNQIKFAAAGQYLLEFIGDEGGSRFTIVDHSRNRNLVSDGVPATATSPGVVGQVAWNTTHFYVCVAANTWRRVALSTW